MKTTKILSVVISYLLFVSISHVFAQDEFRQERVQFKKDTLSSQLGVEGYWKFLLLPSLWVTPGVQVIFDPTFNPAVDNVTIGRIDARLFF
jgi:hypothetical protein